MSLSLLDPNNPAAPFPPVDQAEEEPNGLLALGGDLSLPRLLNAYHHGIFPWYSDDQPILWWSPAPRTVLFPQKMRLSRSLRKAIRNRGHQVSINHAFPQVIHACAAIPRINEDGEESGTWITTEMRQAYENLHRHGHAHSVEIWSEERLVGGLYGVMLGKVFFGESMFSLERDTSKIALAQLADRFFQLGGKLIDCQVYTNHLDSLGAEEVGREAFSRFVQEWTHQPLESDELLGMEKQGTRVPEFVKASREGL